MNVEKLLDEELNQEFEGLKGIEIGSECYKNTVNGITALVDRKIEIEKTRKDETLRKQQLKDERIDRWVKNGLTGVSIVGGLAFSVWGFKTSILFEDEHFFSSSAGKEIMKRIFKMK